MIDQTDTPRPSPGPAAELLHRLRETLDLDRADVARALNVAATSYAHYETRYKKSALPRELAEPVAQLFVAAGMPPERAALLLSPVDDAVLATLPPSKQHRARAILQAAERKAAAPRPAPGQPMPVDLDTTVLVPLYAAASAGDGQPVTYDVIDRIEMPTILGPSRDAFAVSVAGDSMEPRLYPGDIIYLSPYRSPTPRDTVYVTVRADAGEEGYVKQFVGYEDGHLVLLQHNPRKELRYPIADVVSIAVALGSRYR